MSGNIMECFLLWIAAIVGSIFFFVSAHGAADMGKFWTRCIGMLYIIGTRKMITINYATQWSFCQNENRSIIGMNTINDVTQNVVNIIFIENTNVPWKYCHILWKESYDKWSISRSVSGPEPTMEYNNYFPHDHSQDFAIIEQLTLHKLFVFRLLFGGWSDLRLGMGHLLWQRVAFVGEPVLFECTIYDFSCFMYMLKLHL